MSVRLERSASVPNCSKCMESLMGKQYLMKESSKFCVGCYESMYCNSCNKCMQIISTDSRDISYKDFHFHDSCFSCNGCERCLTDQKFIFKDNKFICERCYEDKFMPKCATCRKTFKAGSKRMEYEGKSYHENCFCCSSCNASIGKKSFVKRSDGYFCQDCFESRLANKCHSCKKIIKSKGVAYKDKTFHANCFLCAGCEKNISGEQFITHDDQPFCVKCHKTKFSKKCHKCGEPISGIKETKMIAFEELSWHVECFTCFECGRHLEGEGFAMHQEETYCEECAAQIP